ncbi:hypothetical protein H6F89_08835 [Cyanobacteria bacterium FACHB-63]|nr:hypothetical protein [Cyanobacteria bacterium FACHB-63]
MTSLARLITIEVILYDSVSACEEAILVALKSHGQPVSWVVAEVAADRQIAIVDALILDQTEADRK